MFLCFLLINSNKYCSYNVGFVEFFLNIQSTNWGKLSCWYPWKQSQEGKVIAAIIARRKWTYMLGPTWWWTDDLLTDWSTNWLYSPLLKQYNKNHAPVCHIFTRCEYCMAQIWENHVDLHQTALIKICPCSSSITKMGR